MHYQHHYDFEAFMTDDPMLDLQEEVQRLRSENEQLQQELHNLRQFVYALESVSEATQEQTTEHTPESQEHLNWWLNHILEQTLMLLDAPQGSVLLVDQATNELVFTLVNGMNEKLIGKRLKMDEGIAGWVASNNKVAVVENVSEDNRFSSRIDNESGYETRSLIAAPLVNQGKVIGVVEVINQIDSEPFNDLHQAMLGLFCDFAGSALGKARG